MKKPLSLLAVLPLLAPLAACSEDLSETTDPDCLDQKAPAVSVTVLDATTGGPLPVEALATVQAEGRTAQMVVPANDSTPVGFFEERQGTYDVEVEAPEYQTWDTTGLTVRFGECTVQTAEVRALMRPGE